MSLEKIFFTKQAKTCQVQTPAMIVIVHLEGRKSIHPKHLNDIQIQGRHHHIIKGREGHRDGHQTGKENLFQDPLSDTLKT